MSTTSTAAGYMAFPKTWQHIRHRVVHKRLHCTSLLPATRGRPAKAATTADEVPIFLRNSGHDYLKTTTDTTATPELVTSMTELEQLRVETESLRVQRLSLQNIQDNSKLFQFYTNLPNFAVFDAARQYLQTRVDGNVKRWHGSKAAVGSSKTPSNVGTGKSGPGNRLAFQDEMFIVLVKLKTGRLNHDLAFQFGVSVGLISEIFSSWLCFLCAELKLLFEMVDCGEPVDGIPGVYKNFSGLRVVVDCTELMLQKSSDLHDRKTTFSNYKHHDTVKFLVGMSPQLCVNFVSKAWGGRASDTHITTHSDALLSGLPAGSVVMAVRGFTVAPELSRLGVKTIIPEFKGRGRSQFTDAECSTSEDIAKARIHIERVIQRIKTFHVLDSVVRLNMSDIIEQIFTVCAYLTNFQTPIIRCNEIKME